ncbi:MAG: uncharacterized protein KVP18_001349 [Porospora cf. gigantea A]|uniref:uncharacterized protein n=1 Tax=Porospora cf. gigantea A TaxID=2853593 RepID=UPI00355A20B3|nr:MAG: hypothetical protein KVP18_001349 [Porospora cf. gigantea A]
MSMWVESEISSGCQDSLAQALESRDKSRVRAVLADPGVSYADIVGHLASIDQPDSFNFVVAELAKNHSVVTPHTVEAWTAVPLSCCWRVLQAARTWTGILTGCPQSVVDAHCPDAPALSQVLGLASVVLTARMDTLRMTRENQGLVQELSDLCVGVLDGSAHLTRWSGLLSNLGKVGFADDTSQDALWLNLTSFSK